MLLSIMIVSIVSHANLFLRLRTRFPDTLNTRSLDTDDAGTAPYIFHTFRIVLRFSIAADEDRGALRRAPRGPAFFQRVEECAEAVLDLQALPCARNSGGTRFAIGMCVAFSCGRASLNVWPSRKAEAVRNMIRAYVGNARP